MKHISTAKHKKTINIGTLELNGIKKVPNSSHIYECICCNYVTSHIRDFTKHNNTTKHIKKHQNNKIQHICIQCNKEFNTQSGLWKHKNKCIINEKEKEKEKEKEEEEELQNVFTPTSITPDIFMEVVKQNKELQNKLLEQNKQLLEQNAEQQKQLIELASKPQSIINNNNTSNNQQFNLQFYLNETCKDAMNIVDFVNSLQLTTDDFETTGKLGFIDGISRIFIKELKKLGKEKFPIHCTDFKRETVYIKDNDIWEKENDEKKRVKWAIDTIAQLNLNQLQQWQEKYPECRENNTPANEHFFKLARVALGGFGKEEEDKFREKIMRNVLKEVVLDKKSGKS
jgi:hypothetical protein